MSQQLGSLERTGTIENKPKKGILMMETKAEKALKYFMEFSFFVFLSAGEFDAWGW